MIIRRRNTIPGSDPHCTPEQAIEMANAAGAQFIMPVHHQTFQLSVEPLHEPIERFKAALKQTPQRIALREIGETFILPLWPRLGETRNARIQTSNGTAFSAVLVSGACGCNLCRAAPT